MHRSAHQCFDGLQIDSFGLTDAAEGNLQQAAYFLGDFALDRHGSFFSCGVRVSSTGRRVMSTVELSVLMNRASTVTSEATSQRAAECRA